MPRLAAWTILRSGSGTPLREVDRVAAQRELDPRDRALVRRIVGTEVRRRGALRALTQAFVKTKPSADLAAHLRVGFVQLFFLDQVPPHAAVSETVRAVTDTLGLSKGRVANAVLRNALRSAKKERSGDARHDLPEREWSFDRPIFRDPSEHPLLWAEDALSIPAALMKRFVKRHGEERARELALTFLEEPDVSIRVVTGDRASIASELETLDVQTREGVHDAVLVADSRSIEAIVHSNAFESGRITIQGETALRAAELVAAQPGERILDVCAAPGGKTAVLAGTGAKIIALDSSPRRLGAVRPGLERLGVAELVHVAACDGTAALGSSDFDAALVDAPCSNTGVLGARPGARWRFGPATQRSLVETQTRLLAEAAQRVRPGGRLVYSTCSLEPEENSRVVRAFLEAQSEWRLEEEHDALPTGRGSTGPVDGGYAAKLARSG